MVKAKYEKQGSAETVKRREEVVVPEKETEDAFNRKLDVTIKTALKPEFTQINSRFDQVDMRLAGLESSNSDIKEKLAQIITNLTNLG